MNKSVPIIALPEPNTQALTTDPLLDCCFAPGVYIPPVVVTEKEEAM